MNILSLFDGMSCGYLALQKAGIPIDRYDAYEIDRYALQVSKHNFPDIIQHGDVFNADFSVHKNVDILMGGSPCTYWSIAQKNNRETEASGMGWELFSQYVRALHEVKPKFFVYENNKSMSNAIRQSISDTFGFEPILINSALVSAQNRQRLYWVGKLNDDGTYSKVNIEQPKDKGILLKDILNGVTDREKSRAVIGSIGRTTTREYFKKSQGTMAFESVNTTQDDKSQCLRATYYKDGIRNMVGNNVDKKTCVAEPLIFNVPHGFNNGGFKSSKSPTITANGSWQNNNFVTEPVRIPEYGNNDKSHPLNAHYSNNCGGFEHRIWNNKSNKQQVDLISEPVYVGEIPEHKGKYRNGNQCSQQYRVYSIDGKSVCCNTTGRNNVAIPVYQFQDLKIREGAEISINENAIRGVQQNKSKSSCAENFYEFTDRKTNTLTTAHIPKIVDNIDNYKGFAEPCEWGEDGTPIKAISKSDGKTYTVYEVKNHQIVIKGKSYSIKLNDGYYIIRKLTVEECKRLQTVPEWYDFSVISDSQAYKCLGNGWTIDVITHLLKELR